VTAREIEDLKTRYQALGCNIEDIRREIRTWPSQVVLHSLTEFVIKYEGWSYHWDFSSLQEPGELPTDSLFWKGLELAFHFNGLSQWKAQNRNRKKEVVVAGFFRADGTAYFKVNLEFGSDPKWEKHIPGEFASFQAAVEALSHIRSEFGPQTP
jgi:hypothetical protein